MIGEKWCQISRLGGLHNERPRGTTRLRVPAARCAQAVREAFALKTESAGNAGCPMHPQPVCIGSKHTVVTTGSPASHRHSLHNGFTAYSALSPATNSSCHRRLRIDGLAGPGRACKTSADLTPATAARTTRLHRPQQHRSSARRRSLTGWSPPCHHVSRPTLARPPHPAPTSVTMANAPLSGRDGEVSRTDLGQQRSRIFFRMGLDSSVDKLPVGQITGGIHPALHPEIEGAAAEALSRWPIVSSDVCCASQN
jgi:hypothetical protein